MVVFTCGHCGESVQKPKVEKHYQIKCRFNQPQLSCMDCFKDFLGKEYLTHTKCITEEERYSGKGFVPKEKKGEVKQNTWVETLQSVIEENKNVPKNVYRILETASQQSNTPRKKPKFINFVKNACGAKTNLKDIEAAWDLISKKLSLLSKQTEDKNKNSKSGNEQDNGEEDNSNTKLDEQVNGEEKSSEAAENSKSNFTNGEIDVQNGDTETVSEKKLSKKQRKEEKKRQKYEAELQSAEVVPDENEEVNEGKKGKKKKNRTESTNGNVEEQSAEGKKKKRKRLDTATCPSDTNENATECLENAMISKEKTKKKKQKVELNGEAVESVANGCLHDQNVAKIEELSVQDKFNWHSVIISVLEKKDNEVPFKRLQKKVLSEYSEATGRDVDDRIAEKFIKKLKSAPNVRVDKNRVLLIQ